MARFIRYVALLFITAPLAAMFSEPFFEALFDQIGVDSENWVPEFILNFETIVLPEWLSIVLFILIGVGLGIWVHYFALIRDRSKPSRGAALSELHGRIALLRDDLKGAVRDWHNTHELVDGKGRWSVDLHAQYASIRSDLVKLGLDMPKARMVSETRRWEDRAAITLNLLGYLETFSLYENYDEAKKACSDLTQLFEAQFGSSDARQAQ